MTFEVINVDSTNTIATFEDQGAALEEYEEICAEDRSHRDSYIVVEFDDEGEARGVVVGPQAAVERFGATAA
jgi:hypothetical protein